MQSRGKSGPARSGARGSTRRSGPPWLLVLPPLLALLAVPVALVHFNQPAGDDIPRDNDLCPVDGNAISSSAVFLVDFNKPLDKTQTALPAELLRNLSLQLDRNAELRIFALTDSEHSPRAPLSRLCKPYGNADLQIEQAKDGDGTLRDCDDLPAQLASGLRQSAAQFCARRDELQRRLEALANQPWQEGEAVTDAYLVEALEDTRLEFAERPAPHALYLFSDMMQHADWYSHLDLEWTDWTYEVFAGLLQTRSWLFPEYRSEIPMRVEAFYVPRIGLTDQPRAKRLHQQFWRDYFSDAQVTFHDQPPMPAYQAQPLMALQTDMEVGTQEHEIAERLLQLKREQEALERELEAERPATPQTDEQQSSTLPQPDEQQPPTLPLPGRSSEAPEQRPATPQADEPQAPAPLQPEPLMEGPERTQPDGPTPPRTLPDELQAPAPPQPEPSLEVPERAQPDRQPPPRTLPDEPEAPAPAQPEHSLEAPGQAQTEPALPPPQQALPIELESPASPQPGSPVEEAAATGVQRTAQPPPDGSMELPPCAIVPTSEAGHQSPVYPQGGTFDFGNARITVRYVVDELGQTVDDEVVFMRESSSWTRSRYLRLFTRESIRTVQEWAYVFPEGNDESCTRRQVRSVSFVFEFE